MPGATLRDLLQRMNEREGARLSFADDEGELTTLDVAALMSESARLASVVAPSASPGDLIILALADPRDFLPVFWACQLRGLVPVPLAPPLGDVAPFTGAWEAWGRPPVVTDAAVLERAPEGLSQGAQDGRALRDLVGELPCPTGLDDDDALALVQPSSGTTGRPRGVQLSHRNLIENVRQLRDRLALGPEDTVLSWMPLFHDMGLIATHLVTLAAGAHQVWMTPSAFFRRPELWLRIATDTGATILTGTNTALRLLSRRLDDDTLRRADLSRVRRFLVGAEPISPRVLRDVERRLSLAKLPRRRSAAPMGSPRPP